MSQIWLPRTLTEQPQFAAQPSDYWLSRGLVFLSNESQSINTVQGDIGFQNSTVKNFGLGGVGAKLLTTSAYVRYSNSSNANVSGAITCMAFAAVLSISSDQSAISKNNANGSYIDPTPFDFGLSATNTSIRLGRSNISGYRVWCGTIVVPNTVDFFIAATQTADISVAPKFYLNGVFDTGAQTNLYGGAGSGAADINAYPVRVGNRGDLTTSWEGGRIYMTAVFSSILTAQEIAQINKNPWQLFKAPPRRIWAVSGAPANNLVGDSVQGQSASAALLQSISLAAASVQLQSSSGAMSIGVPLTGQSAQMQLADGTLNITIPLNGQAIQQQVASGALGVGVNLAGQSDQIQPTSASLTNTSAGTNALIGSSAQIQPTSGALGVGVNLAGQSDQIQPTSGALGVGVNLAGQSDQIQPTSASLTNTSAGTNTLIGSSAQIQSAFGTIGISVTLSAASLQQAFSQGVLTNAPAGTINFVGSSVQSSSASGLMDVAVNLSGNSATVHSANGTLATIVPLAGVSSQVHSASGGFIITAQMSAESLQQQSAVGAMTMRISLNAESVQQAINTATLNTSGTLVPDGRYMVYALGRNFTISGV